MSQYRFKSADGKREFLTGWDRPLRYHFLVIDENDETVFSNLDLPNPAMNVEQVKETCKEFGTELPEQIEQSLREDVNK